MHLHCAHVILIKRNAKLSSFIRISVQVRWKCERKKKLYTCILHDWYHPHLYAVRLCARFLNRISITVTHINGSQNKHSTNTFFIRFIILFIHNFLLIKIIKKKNKNLMHYNTYEFWQTAQNYIFGTTDFG